MNTKIINNLKRAIEIFEAFPAERLNLLKWASQPDELKDRLAVPNTDDHTCETLFCGAGWLATQPEFLDQLRISFGDGIFAGWGFKGLANALSDSEEIFGFDPFDRLFSTAGNGDWDDDLMERMATDDDSQAVYNKPMSDKDLLIARFRRQLAIYEEHRA